MLTRAYRLEPALALAQRAAGAILQEAGALTVEAGDIDLDAGLGEGEEVRAQADVAAVAEGRARELQERPFSASVMSSSTARPSISWNCGVWVASGSGR